MGRGRPVVGETCSPAHRRDYWPCGVHFSACACRGFTFSHSQTGLNREGGERRGGGLSTKHGPKMFSLYRIQFFP